MDQLKGFGVEIEAVRYLQGIEAPPGRPHSFAFFLQVINQSEHDIRLLARKSVVLEDNGETWVVEGFGVAGRVPVVPAGGGFDFNSYHFVSGNALAQGALLGELEDGTRVVVPVPEFRMCIPAWARNGLEPPARTSADAVRH
ncbi:MAG TPA: ApaG domain [Verrucomicrobiales bacterium]|nr:ApaG domain [Verrucomicrobiales bacterium]